MVHMKNLSALVKSVSGSSELVNSSKLDPEITGLSADSREVRPGFLFFAIEGEQADGNRFVPEAINNGTVAIVSGKPAPKNLPDDALYLQVDEIHRAAAEISAEFYDHTHRQFTLIGITGTNGKTTTASLIHQLLRSLDTRALFVGTTGIRIGDRTIHSDYTTPPPEVLHRLFSEAYEAGIRHAVMEVSSHGIALFRSHGLRFKAAVFTNLTHEHLELHADLEDYFATKASLFESLAPEGIALINSDDPYGKRLLGIHENDPRFFTYGRSAGDFALRAYRFLHEKKTSLLEYTSGGRVRHAACGLVGFHNGYNSLAAVATVSKMGFDPDRIDTALAETTGIEGRFDWFEKNGINVVVDFAHSPDALQQLLESVGRLRTDLGLNQSRIVLVFGCPGNRDPSKRPAMGLIAANNADFVFVTSDDPHYEEPAAIVAAIQAGIPANAADRINIDPDRRSAIRKALVFAKKTDFVVVAGRGHQRYQYVRDEKVPFNDREEILKILEQFA